MASPMVDRIVDVIIQKHLDRLPGTNDSINNMLPPASFYEHLVHAIIDEMRSVPEVCSDQYHYDKVWPELSSVDVWNLWLDAIVRE